MNKIDLINYAMKEHKMTKEEAMASVNEYLKWKRAELSKSKPHGEASSVSENEGKRKSCHSFWHRECENKNKECYRCELYY